MARYYVAHRLFAAHDRSLATRVALQVAAAAGPDSVFLPFCDTDEENLVSACKGRTLFELDCARLREISGMIAILHGPSLDDGVCMETGFAAALGVPVILVTTDFQSYASRPGGETFVFAEPLLETTATAVVRVHRLGLPHPHDTRVRHSRFLAQNLAAIRTAGTRAVTELLTPREHREAAPTRTGPRLAYLEPSPYIPDQMWATISAELRARAWTVYTARRYTSSTGTALAAREDWAAATAADLAVVDTRGPETPPGAALVIGANSAASRPVLAAHTGTWQTLADGREPNWRNLMIQYAVTNRFSSLPEFTAALDKIPCPAP
jgi:hypothetical protein